MLEELLFRSNFILFEVLFIFWTTVSNDFQLYLAKEGWEEELAASLYENWQIYEWMHGNDSK